MKLIAATHNAHKVSEIKEVLAANIQLVSLADINYQKDIAETADTLSGNALIKARTIYQEFGENCFADDTGLIVGALDGAPGVKSARYAGENATAELNNEKLLAALKDKQDRSAYFETVIALILDGEEYLFSGRVDGEIALERKGEMGFGYDPLFKPEGKELHFAQMSSSEKNSISHRARAVSKLCDFLNKQDDAD